MSKMCCDLGQMSTLIANIFGINRYIVKRSMALSSYSPEVEQKKFGELWSSNKKL